MHDGIELCNVSKSIKDKTILDHVTMSLERGGIYGFTGINGSGKTMLFRAIAGLIHISEGELYVFSKKIGEDVSFPENMGIIIESVGFWPDYTGFENLKLLSKIRNKIGDEEISNALERLGLDPKDTRKYKKYSLGMKQRLGIAQAIMEEPDLLILDEPTNSLDEDGIRKAHDIIREENKRGATVLIASHNRSDINGLCQRVFNMKEGRLTEEKQVEENEN